jgi:hypothetical protein
MSNENTPGLQDALDQMDIRNLISRYCWAIDKNDRELFSQVFAPEATADLGNVHCVGIDAIWARIRQALGPLDASQHITGSQEISLCGTPQKAVHISSHNMCAEPPKMALITSSLANTLTTLFALHKAGAFNTAHSM